MVGRRREGGRRRRFGPSYRRGLKAAGPVKRRANLFLLLLLVAGVGLASWWTGLATLLAQRDVAGGAGRGEGRGTLPVGWEPVASWFRAGWEQLSVGAAELVPRLGQRLATDGDLPRYLIGQGMPLAQLERGDSASSLGRELQAVLEQVADYPLDDPHSLVVRHFPGGRFRVGSPDVAVARGRPGGGRAPREQVEGQRGGQVPNHPGDQRQNDDPPPLADAGGGPGGGPWEADDSSLAPQVGGRVRFEAVQRHQSGLSAGPGVRDPSERAPGGPAAEELRPAPGVPSWGSEPLVAILHAHTSEMYRTDDFAPPHPDDYHRFNSEDTGIIRVGEAMAQRLREHGVGVIHSRRIHDYPVHPLAYREARKTVQELLERYPSLVLILDVHRDSPSGLTATVAGQPVGQVMILVGSGEATRGLANPTWRSNLRVAQELEAILHRRYPGLHRRTWVRSDARFNQDLHPGMLLLEIGSYDTHIEEAKAAARMVADAVAEWLALHYAPRAEP